MSKERILPVLAALALLIPAPAVLAATLVIGSRGADVQVLQSRLNDTGFGNTLALDGIFGRLTAGAVSRLQLAKGMASTGIADNATQSALMAVLAKDYTPVSGLLGTKSLETGDEGVPITALQTDLKALGYGPVVADGVFGPTTATALKAFQTSNGLPATGIGDPATLILLVALNEPTLSPGAAGPSVTVVQKHLQSAGYFKGTVTGVLDTTTETALKAFQRAKGLPATGVVNTATWRALLSPATSPSPPGPQNPPAPNPPTPNPPPAAPPASKGVEVLAYWIQRAGSGSFQSYTQNKVDLTEIAPLWYSVRADGTIKQWWPAAVPGVVQEAHRDGKKVIALVNNASASNGMLTSPAVITASVNNLVAIAKANHLDGYNIDFEGITGYNAAGLVAFMSALHARLAPLGMMTTVAVGPRSSTNLPLSELSAAYDYIHLAPVVDRMVIMTYDQHGTSTGPGPVAGIGWVKTIVNYALSVGVPPGKILLGIADYGYDWSSGGTQSITAEAALTKAASAGATVRLDSTSQEDTFTYHSAQGAAHTVWVEDAHSLAAKLSLVAQDHLAGVGLWVLGSEDAGYFSALRRSAGSILP